MSGKKIAAGILGSALLMSAAIPASAQRIEFRLSFGGWTLAPLHTAIETECEEIIQNEFFSLLDSILPESTLSPVRTDVSLSSSGTFLSGEIWIPIGRSPFAAGLRGDLFSFHIPFSAAARETIDLFGVPVAELTGRGIGTVDLAGFGLSLLGRWTAVSSPKWEISLHAGISALPFRGRIGMDQILSVSSILGDYQFSGRLDQTIAEIREVEEDIPTVIIAPAAGFDVRYRIGGNAGLSLNLTVSQGTYIAAGVFVGL